MVTTANAFSLDASASRPRRTRAGRRRDLARRAKYRAARPDPRRSVTRTDSSGTRGATAGAAARPRQRRRTAGRLERAGAQRAAENKKARATGPGFLRAPKVLGEVVPDVAEDVLELTTKEDHGDDDGNGDNGDDESVLDQSLPFVVTEECEHVVTPPLSLDRRTGWKPVPPGAV